MNIGQSYPKFSNGKGVLRKVNWHRMNICLRKKPAKKTNGVKSRIQVRVDKHADTQIQAAKTLCLVRFQKIPGHFSCQLWSPC